MGEVGENSRTPPTSCHRRIWLLPQGNWGKLPRGEEIALVRGMSGSRTCIYFDPGVHPVSGYKILIEDNVIPVLCTKYIQNLLRGMLCGMPVPSSPLNFAAYVALWPGQRVAYSALAPGTVPWEPGQDGEWVFWGHQCLSGWRFSSSATFSTLLSSAKTCPPGGGCPGDGYHYPQ